MLTVQFAHVRQLPGHGRRSQCEIVVEGNGVWKFLVIQQVFVVVEGSGFEALHVISILLVLLLLLSLLLRREARFGVGRNRRHTCFVIQPCGRLCRVTIGNVTSAIGNGPPSLLLLWRLLLLDRLQGVALVDSGHPVAPLVEHLSHLASTEGRRQISCGDAG